jgi:hypothetical protein
MQRLGRNKLARARVEHAMRRGQDLVVRDHHTAAGGAGLVVKLADRRPRLLRRIDAFAVRIRIDCLRRGRRRPSDHQCCQ